MMTIDSPLEVLRKFSLSTPAVQFLKNSRSAIQDILDGKDDRFLIILGPCSIHDVNGALEFADRLKRLQEACPSFFFVMRTYFEKARTSYGWKGFLYDPYLNGTHQISHGVAIVREFLLALAEKKIPAGCEFLDPSLQIYFKDLISWGCIGARTAASQIHRQLASGFDMPIGFKNTPEGSLDPAVHGILSASKPHTFLATNLEGKLGVQRTSGNSCTHLVLRGGERGPNFSPEDLAIAQDLLKKWQLPERIIVDCSHDNSKKQHELQLPAFSSVLHQMIEGNHAIRGAMLESYLLPGAQPLNHPLQYGVSITDSCLSWEMTETLLLKAHRLLQETPQEVPLKCVSV